MHLGHGVFPACQLITGLYLAYLGSLLTTACYYSVDNTRLGGIGETCYDRLATRFRRYDAATLQPFRCSKLTTWHNQFLSPGPAAGGSDSDREGSAHTAGSAGADRGGPGWDGTDSDYAPTPGLLVSESRHWRCLVMKEFFLQET